MVYNPDKEDEELRELRNKGIEITWIGMLSQLTAIKQQEFNWIILYSGITLPVIGYLFVRDDGTFPNSDGMSTAISVFYFVVTIWFYLTLFDQRQGYYKLMLCVRRAQSRFRLEDADFQFLPKSFQFASLVKATCTCGEINGTKFFSNFLFRIAYLAALNVLLTFAAFWTNQLKLHVFCHNDASVWVIPLLAIIVLQGTVILILYFWDREQMALQVFEQHKLPRGTTSIDD